MNKNSIFFTTATLVLIVFCSTIFYSCKKDKSPVKYNNTTLYQPCATVTCFNGGVCLDGLCNCPNGFEGSTCSTPWNAKFVGSYGATDNCYTGSGTYPVQINAVYLHPDQIDFSNFTTICQTEKITAIIGPQKTSFNIPIQNACGNNYISGTGNISGNTINVFIHNRDTVLHTTTDCSIILNK